MLVTLLPEAVIEYRFSSFGMFFEATFNLGKSFGVPLPRIFPFSSAPMSSVAIGRYAR